jgi:glyoxylase-like metal-dependent hydrolase (beta-lactamase superfamily II)
MLTEVAPGVFQIDTLLGGWERVTAGYFVEGPPPILVETGSQSSVPALLDALDAHGVGPDGLAGVVVTHIHLDHAGGVGDVAAAFPDATVYVHPLGARHLADPSRLVDSAGRVYGDLLDSLYGRLSPTAPDRIIALEDGETVGTLTAVHSPGHAKHHLALHDEHSGLLFVGDAVGVRLPDVGVLRPATPPPDFDLVLALSSLRRFDERRPSALALAHFGVLPDPPSDALAEAEDVLCQWADVAERAWREGEDVEVALEARFGASHKQVEILNGVHSNAAGLRRWLDHRPATEP